MAPVICQSHGIAHKLTQPYRPQTNGMAERFIAEALDAHPKRAANTGRNRFSDHAQRDTFIKTFVQTYNRTRLRCLGHKAPAELLPNLPGHNTFASMTVERLKTTVDSVLVLGVNVENLPALEGAALGRSE